MDQLLGDRSTHPHLNLILNNIDVLVTGPFIQEERDITLPYRGSKNQTIWALDHEKNIWYNKPENVIGGYSNVRARSNE